MYKIGDLVRIKKRKGNSDDYPLQYTNEMLKFETAIARIVDIYPKFMQKKCFRAPTFDGDTNTYKLDIDHQYFFWSSSMFESYITNSHFVDLKNILR